MEPAEQNAFLDFVYASGQMTALLAALRARARDAAAAAGPPAASSGGGLTPTVDVLSASSAGAHVTSIEAILDVVGSTLGAHGYRSHRLTLEPNLWQALRDLVGQRRGSVRASATRFLRTLITVHTACAMRVAEHDLLSPLLQQLTAHVRPGVGARDSLANSAALALLHAVGECEGLAPLRHHILGHHRHTLEALGKCGILAARDFVNRGGEQGADAPAAESVAAGAASPLPSEQADPRASSAHADADALGAGGVDAERQSPQGLSSSCGVPSPHRHSPTLSSSSPPARSSPPAGGASPSAERSSPPPHWPLSPHPLTSPTAGGSPGLPAAALAHGSSPTGAGWHYGGAENREENRAVSPGKPSPTGKWRGDAAEGAGSAVGSAVAGAPLGGGRPLTPR